MLTPASTFVYTSLLVETENLQFSVLFYCQRVGIRVAIRRCRKGSVCAGTTKSPRPPRRPHEVKPRPQTRHFTRVRPVRSFRGFLLKLSGTEGGTYASKKCYSDAEGEPPHPRRFSPGQGTGKGAPATEYSVVGRGRLLQSLKGQA